MFNFNNLVGNIKKIHNKTKTSEKIVDAMIVDYTFNPNLNIAKQHRIDYVTTSGITGNMFINENTTFTDIEVSEHVKKYLLLIKESMTRKKEAHKIYIQETENIKTLTIDLLKEDNALSKEVFEKELKHRLEGNSIHYVGSDSYNGKVMLNYALNSNVSIKVILKKHFIYQIGVRVCKGTSKILKELDYFNQEEYNNFMKDFSVFNFEDFSLKEFLKDKQLNISTSNHLSFIDENKEVEFNELTSFRPTNSDNILIFNNDSIELILDIIKFIK